MKQVGIKLIPSEGMHLKNIHSGDIHDTYIYLGKYDSADNYVEVTEDEYQEYINRPIEVEEEQTEQ